MNTLFKFGISAILLSALVVAHSSCVSLSALEREGLRFESSDPALRDAAARAIAEKGEEAIPHIRKWLKSSDEKRIIGACLALEHMKDDTWQKALPELGKILDQPISDKTLAAAAVLVKHEFFWEEVYQKRKACLRNMKFYIFTESKDNGSRAFAAGRLAYMQTPRVTEALTVALRNDKSCMVREVAAHALGLNLDPSAVEVLIETLKNKAIYDTCEDAFLSGGADLRAAAAASLGLIGDTRATTALLKTIQEKPAGNDDFPEYVFNAAGKAIADMCDPKAFDFMLRMLESQNQRNRYYAVRYFRDLGDPRAVKPIITMLDNSRNPDYYKRPYTSDNIGSIQYDYDFTEDIRQEAFNALAEIGNAEAVEPLLKFLLKPEKDTIPTFAASLTEMYATETLGRLGDKRVVARLVEELDDDALTAAQALLEIGGPAATSKAVAKLLQLAHGQDMSDRIEALKVLAKMDKPRAISMLTDIMKKSQDKDARYEAAVALGLLGEAGALETLKTMLYDKEYHWNEKAIQTLLRIDNPRVLPVLIEKLKSAEDVWDKIEVAKALAVIGNQRAAGPLLEVFKICVAAATAKVVKEKESGMITFSDEEKPMETMAAILAKFPTPEAIKAFEEKKNYCNSMERFALAWIRGGKDLDTAWNSVRYKDWFQDYARAHWGDRAALHNVIMDFHEHRELQIDELEVGWRAELFAPDIFSRMPEGFPEYDLKASFNTKIRQAKDIRAWYRRHRQRLAWDEEKKRYYLRDERK